MRARALTPPLILRIARISPVSFRQRYSFRSQMSHKALFAITSKAALAVTIARWAKHHLVVLQPVTVVNVRTVFDFRPAKVTGAVEGWWVRAAEPSNHARHRWATETYRSVYDNTCVIAISAPRETVSFDFAESTLDRTSSRLAPLSNASRTSVRRALCAATTSLVHPGSGAPVASIAASALFATTIKVRVLISTLKRLCCAAFFFSQPNMDFYFPLDPVSTLFGHATAWSLRSIGACQTLEPWRGTSVYHEVPLPA